MIYSRIVATGAYLPARVVRNDEFAQRLDTTDSWIRERTGIVERRIADASQGSSDLALEASRAALAAAQLAPGDIDLIIVATSTPDFVFPSTACLLQAKLGAKGCPAFDVQAVCSGFIYGLATADSFIRGGTVRRALVVGTEVFSRIMDWNDRATCVLFGDGAGAVVLAADSAPGIHASALHADGSYASALSVPGNVSGGRIVGSPYLQMQGNQVFKMAVKVLDEVARETLSAAGMKVGDIDWLIPHQANVRILEATARKLGLPLERLVVTVDHHGNTSAASVPLALDECVRSGRIRTGHRVLMEGVGGGFTWGAVLATM
ncbi:MAG: 3-oxoacyl-ACP synthase [Betaproteobacteria bacterium RIFCSPLOWO2_02_67_12]|nr:MAG: 3-oxoacyl-ACP synthase [Betaproteobacteria bacterium RIFCSPLOWO2_02_67_12]OGA30901.1 MAG: 3-oxoacyl-ACP synthase [Betaproteobacteria bacterium RIFCSPLOWO2_02_FULL_68_150]OGA72237.1 MAG: 3-oxoacyl-ACP synthase [Betaproteobacteria bacterium RIFCSPLOWO2_12_FULL_67_28]